ncbi:MAG: hypothetical protein CMJ81_24105 [Planctomycetaceae bacterium]|nr:hypothetical protein [Planctomycetaceae bacterium]MBP62051.1 hypothetical protein [Planctomycetaceae bacterium]
MTQGCNRLGKGRSVVFEVFQFLELEFISPLALLPSSRGNLHFGTNGDAIIRRKQPDGSNWTFRRTSADRFLTFSESGKAALVEDLWFGTEKKGTGNPCSTTVCKESIRSV